MWRTGFSRLRRDGVNRKNNEQGMLNDEAEKKNMMKIIRLGMMAT
jgi:hypothetical protein